jgi:hypothetical protein
MSGHLINVALSALGQTDLRAFRMRDKDEGFRMLKNFLKGVFILVDIHNERMPAPNSRKKKITDILTSSALEQYTFIKDDAMTTVKVCCSVRPVTYLTLVGRTTSSELTTKI